MLLCELGSCLTNLLRFWYDNRRFLFARQTSLPEEILHSLFEIRSATYVKAGTPYDCWVERKTSLLSLSSDIHFLIQSVCCGKRAILKASFTIWSEANSTSYISSCQACEALWWVRVFSIVLSQAPRSKSTICTRRSLEGPPSQANFGTGSFAKHGLLQ